MPTSTMDVTRQPPLFQRLNARRHSVALTAPTDERSRQCPGDMVDRHRKYTDSLPLVSNMVGRANSRRASLGNIMNQLSSISTSSSDSSTYAASQQQREPSTPKPSRLSRRQSMTRATVSSLAKMAPSFSKTVQDDTSPVKPSKPLKDRNFTGLNVLKRRSSMMVLTPSAPPSVPKPSSSTVVKSNGPKTASTPPACDNRGWSSVDGIHQSLASQKPSRVRRTSTVGSLDLTRTLPQKQTPSTQFNRRVSSPGSQTSRPPTPGHLCSTIETSCAKDAMAPNASFAEHAAARGFGFEASPHPNLAPSETCLRLPTRHVSPGPEKHMASNPATGLDARRNSVCHNRTTHPQWLASAGFMRRPKCTACGPTPASSQGATSITATDAIHPHQRRPLSRAISMCDVANGIRTGTEHRPGRVSVHEYKQQDSQQRATETSWDVPATPIPNASICCRTGTSQERTNAPTAAETAANVMSTTAAVIHATLTQPSNETKPQTWTQMIQYCVTQSHRLDKLAHEMMQCEQRHTIQGAAPKQMAEDAQFLSQIEALMQSQRRVLDDLDTLLSTRKLANKKTIQHLKIKYCQEEEEEEEEEHLREEQEHIFQQDPLIHRQLSTPPASPSLSPFEDASSSTPKPLSQKWLDALDNSMMHLRWQFCQLVGGSGSTGRIMECNVGADGLLNTLVVEGTGVTTETQLVPNHMQQNKQPVYFYQYLLRLGSHDCKAFVALTPEKWVPDTVVHQCEFGRTGNVATKCNVAFNWRTRRHHCRKCGHVFCKTHSANRLPLIDTKDATATWSRVCDDCFYHTVGPYLKRVS